MAVTIFVTLVVKPLSPSASTSTPVRFDLDFSFKINDTRDLPLAKDQLAMKPMRPSLLPLRYIARQPNGRFVERIDLPRPNDTYYTILRRKATDSSKQLESPSSELCFLRPSLEPGVSLAAARFECEEGRMCKISKDDGGWVKPCPVEAGWQAPWPFSVRTAWAQAVKSGGRAAWVVPSLQSLQESDLSDGTGYTKFGVKSVNLPRVEANVIQYEVSVNRTKVRIDGFSPDELSLPYDPKKGININFGLQNLDFSGADAGHDTIGLKIELLKDQQIAREYDLKLCYVALRSSPAQVLEVSGGARFEWKADYIQAKNEREYEVFIHSTTNPKDAEARRSLLTSPEWTYADGSEIRGVTRPSLSDNPNYGVAIGLEQPSGRIRFTYDQPTARRLLKWILSKRADPAGRRIVQPDSYLYRIGTRDQIQSPCKVGE